MGPANLIYFSLVSGAFWQGFLIHYNTLTPDGVLVHSDVFTYPYCAPTSWPSSLQGCRSQPQQPNLLQPSGWHIYSECTNYTCWIGYNVMTLTCAPLIVSENLSEFCNNITVLIGGFFFLAILFFVLITFSKIYNENFCFSR